MNDGLPSDIAHAARCLVVLPAGCGKTELVAKAVARAEGRQLVLTHTHAGVRALRRRLAAMGVSPTAYRVDTIASWALEYAEHHPAISSYRPSTLHDDAWESIYTGAAKVVAQPIGRRIVAASYRGVFVDEYQDCSAAQHLLVKSLADQLPCRLFGDPLQAIFSFKGQERVPWEDVERDFRRVPVAVIPWRWKQHNKALGEWLLAARKSLEDGDPLDLGVTVPGLVWTPYSEETRRNACYSALRNKQASTIVLADQANVCHDLARHLGGPFTSMDEQERRDLFAWCEGMDSARETQRAVFALDLCKKCITGVPDALTRLQKNLALGRASRPRDRTALAFLHAATAPSSAALLAALSAAEKESNFVFRKDLWNDAMQVLHRHVAGSGTYVESARRLRLKARFSDARLPRYVVSRTRLVKGLECEQVVVTNADELDRENLYVALTRASEQLIVLSETRMVRPRHQQPSAGRQLRLPLL